MNREAPRFNAESRHLHLIDEELEEDAKRRAKNEVAWLLVEANRETKEEGRA